MKRRKLFRHSLSFFLGLNLVYLKSKSVRSENSPSPNKENNITTTVSGQIQPSFSLEYFQNVLSTNPLFKSNYSHFVERNFDFQTDSINFIDVQNNNNEPFFFTQLSGQRKKENENDSLLESVSLSSVYTNKSLLNLGISGAILANQVNNNTQLINALVLYPSSDNLDKIEKIERDFLEKESPEAIANKIRSLEKSLPNQVQEKKLDLDPSIILDNQDNFLFLLLSIKKDVQLSIDELNHSDKYILEKLSQVISIFIDQYKSEVEKLRISFNKMTLLSSVNQSNDRFFDSEYLKFSSELPPAFQLASWPEVVITIISVVSSIITIGSFIKGCFLNETKQLQETTRKKLVIKWNGKELSVEYESTTNVGNPFTTQTLIPGCTSCGK